MANVLVSEYSLMNIADAIRSKNGGNATYKPREMAPAILAIETGTIEIGDSGYIDDDILVVDGDSSTTWETECDTTVTVVSDSPNYISITNYTDPILADEVYRVTFDGVTYTFTTVYSSQIGYYFGNPGVVNPSEDDGSGANFLFYKRSSSQLVAITTEQPGQITLKIEKQIGGGSSKNIQAYHGYDEVNSDSYEATDVTLTVAKTGTYKVSWMGFRNSTSGTSGSQLYIGNTAYGSANTTFTRSYGQSVVLTDVSLTQGQTVTVYARSRNTSYYMGVGNLIIEEQ